MKHIIILMLVLIAAGLGWNHLNNLSGQNEQKNQPGNKQNLTESEIPKSTGPVISTVSNDIILQRQKIMRDFARRVKLIKKLTDNEEISRQEIAGLAAEIAIDAEDLFTLFPQGTSYNDVSHIKTDARPEIWIEFSKFQTSVEQLIFEAGQLEIEVGGSSERASIMGQLERLGRNGCANCHLSYRRPS